MREIEHLSRLYVAHLFVCAEETKEKSSEDLKVMQGDIGKQQDSMVENERKVKELLQEIKELEAKRDKVGCVGQTTAFISQRWFHHRAPWSSCICGFVVCQYLCLHFNPQPVQDTSRFAAELIYLKTTFSSGRDS